jgi:predicted MFS family arabinose efflux permease
MARKIFTHDFVLIFLAQFTSSFVFYGLIPTLPIYLSRLRSTEVETGILIGIFFFSSLVLRPFVGKALLRIPEKTFLMAGALLYVFSSVAYLFAPPFWPFLIVRVLHGIGFAFIHTSAFTLVVNISSEAHRGQTLGYFSLAMTLSSALAPSIGVFLINHFSFSLLFLVCLGLSLCSLFIMNQLGRRQIVPSQDSSIEKDFFLDRKAIPSSIINALTLFMWGALAAFFPLYAINQGVTNPGLFFTTIAIMLLLGRVLGGKALDLYRKERIILLCLFTCILSMILLAFSKTLPFFILVAAIWGIGNAFLMPSLVPYTLDRAGSSPGPVMGTFTAISDLGLSLGPVIMGIVLHTTSYPIMFLCLALTGVVNVIYFYFYFFVGKKGVTSTTKT